MNISTLQIVEILLQGGILAFLWKASAIVQEFKSLKERQEEHIKDDQQQFKSINHSLISLEKGVARIEGRINGR